MDKNTGKKAKELVHSFQGHTTGTTFEPKFQKNAKIKVMMT
tara:strand:- start:184 stop:306 length:123 start_codon:yes stop_codon:yes gene_type:complete